MSLPFSLIFIAYEAAQKQTRASAIFISVIITKATFDILMEKMEGKYGLDEP